MILQFVWPQARRLQGSGESISQSRGRHAEETKPHPPAKENAASQSDESKSGARFSAKGAAKNSAAGAPDARRHEESASPRDEDELAYRQKKTPRSGVFTVLADHQRQTRRGPHGVGRNQQRRAIGPQFRRQPPQGPRCQPSPQPPATSVTSDGCSNLKGEAGTASA